MHNGLILWLKFSAAAAMIVPGLIFAAAALPDAALPTQWFVDLAFWPFDGAQDLSTPETRLALAILGGIVFGWGIMMWMVADRVLPKDPALARSMILTGVGCWFPVDSAASIAAGAPFNAVMNIVILLMFVVPLLRRPQGA